MERMEKAALPQALKAATSMAQQAGANASTGTASASSSTPVSAFTDFFNTLQTAAQTGGTNGEDPQALALQLNTCGVPELPGQSLRCQLRGRIEKPDLYAPLKQALDDANLPDKASDLGDAMSLGDKATVGLFFTVVNDSFGREITAGTNQLFQELQDEAESLKGGEVSTARTKLDSANMRFARYLNDVALGIPDVDARNALAASIPNRTFTFNMLPAAEQQQALAEYEALAATAIEYGSTRAKALAATHYFDLARLMNNQPQPQIGFEYTSGGRYAGPDEYRAKVSYETGFVNIRSFRRYQRGSCSKDAEASTSTAICLSRYLKEPGVKKALASTSRLAATVEYVRKRRFTAVVPDTAVSMDEKAVTSWTGSLTYGRYLDPIDSEQQVTRIDVSASYEYVSDDPQRQKRGIASATLTRQIADEWVLAFGLVYATRPEFRAAANKDLSLRLGFNYKIRKKTAP